MATLGTWCRASKSNREKKQSVVEIHSFNSVEYLPRIENATVVKEDSHAGAGRAEVATARNADERVGREKVVQSTRCGSQPRRTGESKTDGYGINYNCYTPDKR